MEVERHVVRYRVRTESVETGVEPVGRPVVPLQANQTSRRRLDHQALGPRRELPRYHTPRCNTQLAK